MTLLVLTERDIIREYLGFLKMVTITIDAKIWVCCKTFYGASMGKKNICVYLLMVKGTYMYLTRPIFQAK